MPKGQLTQTVLDLDGEAAHLESSAEVDLGIDSFRNAV
jgi:hypothetical protein